MKTDIKHFMDEIVNSGHYVFLGSNCPYCDTIITEDNISRDHVIPKVIGIKLPLDFNILVCCKDCNNNKKGCKMPLNFLEYITKAIKQNIEIVDLSFNNYKVYAINDKKGINYILKRGKQVITSSYSKSKIKNIIQGIKIATL